MHQQPPLEQGVGIGGRSSRRYGASRNAPGRQEAQHERIAGTGAARPLRHQFDTNMADYFPEHAIVDLDETYRPQDILDALSDLRFRNGPKMLRIDAQVRDYLVTAVSALYGHDRK
jgi:hypothetical protein